MKNLKNLVSILFISNTILFSSISCNKVSSVNPNLNSDTSKVAMKGKWINNLKDTLHFTESGLLIYKNFNPYYSDLYDFKIITDSLSLILTQSSNFNDRKNYKFEINSDSLIIYKFNKTDKQIFLPIKSN